MNLVRCARDGPELEQRWRQQVASQKRHRRARGPRPLAAITWLIRGPALDGLVDIRHLNIVVLHDRRQDDGSCAIRCAVYSVAGVPWGVRIGGSDGCKLEKDLALGPSLAARGRHFSTANSDLFAISLGLDQMLERHGRYPHFPRRQQPRWPKLWAGFASGSQIELAGPEFERRRTESLDISFPPQSASGLALYPLAYASHAWRQILAVYADPTTVPKRQVINLEPNARNLRGYDGAIEFDLLGSRFSSSASSRRRNITHQHATATLAS